MGKSLVGNWFAARRIRLTVRFAFTVLLAGATFLLYSAMRQQKALAYETYSQGLQERRKLISDLLQRPAGKLVLVNKGRRGATATLDLSPVTLPYGAIQADSPTLTKDLLETVGCLYTYEYRSATACAAVGRNDQSFRRVYVAGSFQAPRLVAHRFLDKTGPGSQNTSRSIEGAHRFQLSLSIESHRPFDWVLPVQARLDKKSRQPTGDLSLTAYPADSDGRLLRDAKPSFTSAWIKQGDCLNIGSSEEEDPNTCLRETQFSIIVPRSAWEEMSNEALPVQPSRATVKLIVIEPKPTNGESPPPLLDSRQPGAPAFELDHLKSLVLPGESLVIQKMIRAYPNRDYEPVFSHVAHTEHQSYFGIIPIILWLPLGQTPVIDELIDLVSVGEDLFEVSHTGGSPAIISSIAENAAQLFAYAVIMIIALVVVWTVFEIGILRRVSALTRITSDVSRALNSSTGDRIDLASMRGSDELGVLASGMDDLLQKVSENVQVQRMRLEHDADTLTAIGHDIRSPLFSLGNLPAVAGDNDARRYIARMTQAVEILWGSSSPADAFAQANLCLELVDAADFLRRTAANAESAGIANVVYKGLGERVHVRADESALETVISHILNNANNYRPQGTAILISVDAADGWARITVLNHGPHIPASIVDRIFQYGVSERAADAAPGHKGQGLYVARTFMLKMGGTITARNEPDGVVFEMRLPLVRSDVDGGHSS